MAIMPTYARSNPNTILPICAVRCITNLGSIIGARSDFCADEELSHSLKLCISRTCTVKESLTTKNVTERICNLPLRNRTNTISITAIVGVSLASLAVLLRLLSRIKSRKPGIDDWTIIAAMGCVIPLAAMAIILANSGLGKDIWSLPFENITHILHIYYFSEMLYLGSLTLIRLSILCLYLRIFSQGILRRITYLIIVANVLYGVAFITASIFQCIPIHAAWTRWDGTTTANCINANAVAWVCAAINIILDAVTVVLPIPELVKLVMSWEQKIYLIVMFGLGSLVTIVSTLRLTSLIKFATTHNVTWDYVPVGYWSSIEVHISVVCACLPTLPSLFQSKTPAHRENDLVVPLAPINRKPRKDPSDVLPLLEVVCVPKHQDIR